MFPSEIVHRGSTKDVYKSGTHYVFSFSDRYSVFDWGEMPDHLSGKGQALARFTKAVYQRLGAAGIKHHLLDRPCQQHELCVKPFEVVRDGSSIISKTNVFIPLEVIFRLGYARGSSLRKRVKSLADWRALGLDKEYQELEMFPFPLIEFTTKLERFDRPLTHEEAKVLSGLNEAEWKSLQSVTATIALELKAMCDTAGILLWDGKIEFALDEKREIVLVDSIGPDELRLTKNGLQLSKEMLREYYRQTTWFQQLEAVKQRHGEAFKEYIPAPPKLPTEFKAGVEALYQALADVAENPRDKEFQLQKICARLRSLV